MKIVCIFVSIFFSLNLYAGADSAIPEVLHLVQKKGGGEYFAVIKDPKSSKGFIILRGKKGELVPVSAERLRGQVISYALSDGSYLSIDANNSRSYFRRFGRNFQPHFVDGNTDKEYDLILKDKSDEKLLEEIGLLNSDRFSKEAHVKNIYQKKGGGEFFAVIKDEGGKNTYSVLRGKKGEMVRIPIQSYAAFRLKPGKFGFHGTDFNFRGGSLLRTVPSYIEGAPKPFFIDVENDSKVFYLNTKDVTDGSLKRDLGLNNLSGCKFRKIAN